MIPCEPSEPIRYALGEDGVDSCDKGNAEAAADAAVFFVFFFFFFFFFFASPVVASLSSTTLP